MANYLTQIAGGRGNVQRPRTHIPHAHIQHSLIVAAITCNINHYLQEVPDFSSGS